MEREQTTIRLPCELKEQIQRKADDNFQKDEAVKFIKLIRKLDKTEQMGVLMMIRGLQITSFNNPRHEPHVPTFEETP